ncbi:MAG TPA: DUF362 domain-containing protein [Bacteroidota bacterium]|nr:DUF362 domain-containing protein [Bacteroidota bacterium]
MLTRVRTGGLSRLSEVQGDDPYDDRTVVRVYDPMASSLTFGQSDVHFYYRSFDVDRLQSMLECAVSTIAGTNSVSAAWRRIMPGLRSSAKVAVKVNINCAHELNGDHGAFWSSAPNTSPYMMAALARSLGKANIVQKNITFFDGSRTFEAEWKADLLSLCPNVLAQGKGEVKVSEEAIVLADGLPEVKIPAPVMEADYLINLHLLKKHFSGTTGAMKNLLGLAENVGAIAHQGGQREFHTGPVLRDISMNPEIRKRAVLCISEAILGNRLPTENIRPLQKVDAFPKGKPSSLIVSRSPFFQDLVLLNLINYEMTGNVNTICSDGQDGWLRRCVGAVPAFHSACLSSARIIQNPAGTALPPTDLSYPEEFVRYIAIGEQS